MRSAPGILGPVDSASSLLFAYLSFIYDTVCAKYVGLLLMTRKRKTFLLANMTVLSSFACSRVHLRVTSTQKEIQGNISMPSRIPV